MLNFEKYGKFLICRILNTCMITIDKTNSVSFGAKFVQNASVKKYLANEGKYVKDRVSFLKIDTNNVSDIKALETVAHYWVNEKYANTISCRAKSIFEGMRVGGGKIYAISAQKENLKQLDPDRILGLVEIDELNPRIIHINHIQVKPDYIYTKTSEYKGIGTAMLDGLKSLYKAIFLTSLREKSVRNFYEKNGFRLINHTKLKYHWSEYLQNRR